MNLPEIRELTKPILGSGCKADEARWYNEGKEPNVPGKSVYTRMGKLSAIVTILPASMAAGWFLGYYLVDMPFGTFPWGSVSATLLGAGAGFYEIIQILAIDRRDTSG